MDATTSNRLARGLFAASQGIGQMVQLRMAQAEQMFRERVFAEQQKVAAQNHQDMLDLRKQALANQQAEAEGRRQDAAARLAFQKESTANSQALREQQIGAQIEATQQRLLMAKQMAELRAGQIAASREQHSADSIANQTRTLQAYQARVNGYLNQLKDMQASLKAAQADVSASPNAHAAAVAQAQAQINAIQGNIAQLNSAMDKMGAQVGQETGLLPASATPKAASVPPQPAKKTPPAVGSIMMKQPVGGFRNYRTFEGVNLPPGVVPRQVAPGTPIDQMQPYDYFTVGAQGATQFPNPNAPPAPGE